jgi:small-conductance mechanosensitive channel
MAEAVKQFFVGFIHPRTWLAAILGLVIAAIVGLAIGGSLVATLSGITSSPTIGVLVSQLKTTALGLFLVVLDVYSALVLGSAVPLLIVVVSAFVAGLVFGILSKKERIASKSIVGGLNIALIYIVVVVIALIIWLVGFSTFTNLYNAVVTLLQGAPYDVLVTFLVVWWVSAIVSMLVLSVKHD